MAVEKKKPRVRVSKNKKKSWNKYCDINDVEEFLEEKRFDERIGGSISEKTDAELFYIQNDAAIVEEDKPKEVKKILKCHQNIGSFSKVPPSVVVRQQRYSKRIANFQTRADEKRTKKVKKNLPNRVKPAKKDIIKVADIFGSELRDLWGEKEKIDPEIEDLVTFRDEYTCKRTPNVPGHRYQKPSLLPSVEVPHSGSSYNPSFDEHQDLLRQAVDIEMKKEKQELHIKRVLTDMFPTKANAPTEASILQEMSQGLFDEEEPEDESVTVNTFATRNPPVSAEDRKTKSRHRRKKERKEKERLRLLAKLQKKRLSEVFRIRSLKSEIRQEAEVTQQRIAKKLERKIESMYKPKTLSAHKYEAPDLEVNLTEELCGSLRDLKTEGNLLEDRYKSLQRRNLIEPRVLQKRKRKYKLKVQVKRNHRDFK